MEFLKLAGKMLGAIAVIGLCTFVGQKATKTAREVGEEVWREGEKAFNGFVNRDI